MTDTTFTNTPTWPDGSSKSTGNAFTSHGYVPGSPVADTPTKNTKRGPRSPVAFNQIDGVIPNMGDRVPRKSRPVVVPRTSAEEIAERTRLSRMRHIMGSA